MSGNDILKQVVAVVVQHQQAADRYLQHIFSQLERRHGRALVMQALRMIDAQVERVHVRAAPKHSVRAVRSGVVKLSKHHLSFSITAPNKRRAFARDGLPLSSHSLGINPAPRR
jgi:hypothetical protein